MASCQDKAVDQNPTTIEGKRALLAEKKEKLKELEEEIDDLTQDIVQNDPELEKKKKIVSTISVTPSDFIKYIDLEGIVVADDVANVVSELPGRILSLTVKEGDYVKKGQVIGALDIESYQTQRNDILTNLQLAQDIYEKRKKLWSMDIGSEVQYLESKNSVERLEKSLELVDIQISKGKIKAPISGIIDREIIKQGELASPGMPIFQVLNTRDVKVQVDLPERYLSILKKGMRLDVHFPSLDLTIPGRVGLLARSIDPANRTLRFEVDVPNKGGLLKPNLLAELVLVESEQNDVVTIPLEMVQQDVNNNSFVMKVVEKDGEKIAERVNVNVEDIYESLAYISEGLNSADILVRDGARLLSDGDLIEIINENGTNE